MRITAFRDMEAFPQFLFAAFVTLVCFLASMVLAFVIAIPLFGFETVLNLASLSDLTNPETIVMLKYFQTIQAIGLFILPALVLGYLFQGNVRQYLHLNKNINSSTVLLTVVLMFFIAPFINLIGEINSNMNLPSWLSGLEEAMKKAEEDAALITEAFVNVKTIPGLAFNLFMIAFLPAVGEELLFRGVIQRVLSKLTKNYHWGIWISAALFSGLHFQFYGFVPRLVLGALFGYLLVWSGSMWLPILGHFLNNAVAVIAMFLIHNNMLNPEYEEIGSTTESYYMAAISLALTLVFLIMIKRQNILNELISPKQKSRNNEVDPGPENILN